VAAFPIAFSCALLTIAVADPARRSTAARAALPCLGGASSAALILILWIARFGALSNFFDQTVRFNAEIYSVFAYGGTPLWVSALQAWREWLPAVPAGVARGDLEALFLPLFLAAVVALAAVVWRARRPSGFRAKALFASEIALSSLLLASLRARGGGFHGVPFVVGVLSVLAIAAAVIATVLAAFSLRDRAAWSSPSINAEEAGTFGAVARYVRAHSREDEPLAVFPFPSTLYLRARRLPATDSVYYFPWQEAWEARHPGRPDTCEQLRRAAPRYVFVWPVPLWNRFQWGERDWGACIDRFVKARYTRVRPEEFDGLLWELRAASPARDTMTR
jgi:hypothetical protein